MSVCIFFAYKHIFRNYCECANEKPSMYKKKTPEKCDVCAGDETEYCGTWNSLSVYKTNRFGKNYLLYLQ